MLLCSKPRCLIWSKNFRSDTKQAEPVKDLVYLAGPLIFSDKVPEDQTLVSRLESFSILMVYFIFKSKSTIITNTNLCNNYLHLLLISPHFVYYGDLS